MGKCVIFCSGDCKGLLHPIEDGDCILAADGGLRHTQALGLTPNGVLGDFDSLGYIPVGAQVFPVEKDDTDAMLAVRRGLQMGYQEFWLYGCLDGPRLDHTVANFQLLQYLADRGAVGYLIGDTYLVTVAQEERLVFPKTAQGVFSLFCLNGQAEVTLEEVKYPLCRGILSSGYPLGVSNRFLGKEGKITVFQGSVLAIWSRENGLPMRKELEK